MSSPWANGEAAEAVSQSAKETGITSRYEQLHAFMLGIGGSRLERMHILWAEFAVIMLTTPGANERDICALMQTMLDQALAAYREIRDE